MAIPVESKDVLNLSTWNSLSGQILQGNLIIQQSDGSIAFLPLGQTPNTDRSVKVTSVQMIDGNLISVFVGSVITTKRGLSLIQLSLNKGGTSGFNAFVQLAQDYVTSNLAVTYPASPLHSGWYGVGARRMIQVTNPANNTEWSLTLATNQALKIYSIRYSFATAAAGTARQSNLKLTDGTNTSWIFPPQGTQAGGATTLYSWTPVTQNTASSGGADQIQPLPDVFQFLGPGYVIGTSTNNLGNTSPDNYTGIFLDVEEFLWV